MADPWKRGVQSWFDEHHTEQLTAGFPKFVSKLSDSAWAVALKHAIYWYLVANKSWNGLDTGLVLAQAALELLSHTYLQQVGGPVPGWAAGRVRTCLTGMGIPTEIPATFPDLLALAQANDHGDAVDALTALRNELVHAEPRLKGDVYAVLYDAWRLALWFVELSLLRVTGYTGTYANRLRRRRVGEVDEVPWMASARTP